MFPHPREPRDPALEKLTVRLARDGQRLRDAVEACPEGLIPDHLVEALLARATVLGRGVSASTSHSAFAVRG